VIGEPENPAMASRETNAVADPHWFPEGFDPDRREFLLVATDRTDLAAQTFLDSRWDRSGAQRTRVASTPGQPARSSKPARIIWHTGFCCSTLLARALNRPSRNLSLCEPQVLVEIAEARRRGNLSRDAASSTAQLALDLLSRPFAANEQITIKPSPAANNLLQVIPEHAYGRMLFLYSDCKSFLISICKMGEDGRKYIRRLFLALLADGHVQSRWPIARLLAMSDLELAAIVWHMQIGEFLRAWPTLKPENAASLDCDALLASPGDVLIRLNRLFSLEIDTDQIQEVISGPLFHRNAKTGDANFDVTTRADEHRLIERQVGDDLVRIVAQSYKICHDTPRSIPLPNPLIGIEKNYSLG
jgi:hypothetical protein